MHRVHPETFRTNRAISNAPLLTKIAADVGICCQDTKESMSCIDNKNVLIEVTNFYHINHYFSYFYTKTSHGTGSILNWGLERLPILHTLTRDALSSFYVRI